MCLQKQIMNGIEPIITKLTLKGNASEVKHFSLHFLFFIMQSFLKVHLSTGRLWNSYINCCIYKNIYVHVINSK